MKKNIVVEGRFISKFTVPKKYIKDLNIRYEKAKKHFKDVRIAKVPTVESVIELVNQNYV